MSFDLKKEWNVNENVLEYHSIELIKYDLTRRKNINLMIETNNCTIGKKIRYIQCCYRFDPVLKFQNLILLLKQCAIIYNKKSSVFNFTLLLKFQSQSIPIYKCIILSCLYLTEPAE